MRKPNFFILGAPKCGTTSLAAWFREHRNIFMPKLKEPHFFNTDDRQAITTLDRYEDLFRAAQENHIAVGEASVWYLSSSEAVRGILRYQPSARFIVMVRNPIEMAPALHGEMLLSGHENVREFATAWSLQEERRRGQRTPVFCWARRRLLYGDVCSLGAQLEGLLSTVPKDRVLPIVMDDLRLDPRGVYLRALQFLDLPDDGRSDFPIHNAAKHLRWSAPLRFAYPMIQAKYHLGIGGGLGLWTRIATTSHIERPRDSLSAELTAALKNYFRTDVKRLGRVLNRDLRSWLE